MAKETHSITDEPEGLSELTQKLEDMGASTDMITQVITHTYTATRATAAMVMEQCNGEPVTMMSFADELDMMRRRIQAMGAAMVALSQEHPNDGYVCGINQMVLDLECNAFRLDTAFDILLGKHLKKN